MPDLLGSLIQLLQLLEQEKFGWLANTVLVVVTIVSVVYFLAVVLFTPRVIRLGKLILAGVSLAKPKIVEAMSSPYDYKFTENKVFLFISLFMYYMYTVFMLFYALLFSGLASGVLLDEKLPITKSLLALFCALAMFGFARFFKCQGDKELFKFRNPKDT
ncbi:hypothetical protein [Vibrio diabolicus]|uniref:hypothetical protein n=1 Tax=Vibrio diabolicus TaxID=50719 RepID=UPI00062BF6AF|nr:hypothetical protein [Vibrio diabolicus]